MKNKRGLALVTREEGHLLGIKSSCQIDQRSIPSNVKTSISPPLLKIIVNFTLLNLWCIMEVFYEQ